MRVTDREVQETIARCVSALVFYRNSKKTRVVEEQLDADAGVLAAWVKQAGLTARDVDALVLGPLEAELVARFGAEAGGGLCGVFVKALRRRFATSDPSPATTALLGIRV
jgi:hypothetical protein